MRPRSGLLVLAVAFIATACRSGTAGDSGTGWLAGGGKPVNLALTFDPDNGEAKVVTPRGGDVSTSGADGTEYRLEIPEGALLSDQRISLIPITAVKGLPLNGGAVAAVHLKPEGLRLLKPATLHIRARADVPVAEQVAFAYFANGKDAHLYPLGRDRSRIELPIFHFSGYGFGRAAPNDPGRIALQQAADKEARLHSRMAELVSRERSKPEGESSNFAQESTALLVQYYKEVLLPLMKIAETDERMAECATAKLLACERELALLGVVDDASVAAAAFGGEAAPKTSGRAPSELDRLRQEAAVSARKIHENHVKKMFERVVKRCKEDHDLHAATELIVAERQAQLLGTTLGPALDDALDQVKKCLSFELEFRSVFATATADGEVTQHYDVQSRVPITYELVGTSLSNTTARAPLKYAAFSFYAVSANRKIRMSGAGTRESALTVFGLAFATTREKKEQTNCAGQDEWQERLVSDTVRVTLSPGKPVELIHGTGPGFNAVTESTGWLEKWHVFRQPEQLKYDASVFSDAEASDLYTLTLRRESPGTWRANFKYSKNDPGSESEDSYVVLRHTPK
jgi:hypothetical protein